MVHRCEYTYRMDTRWAQTTGTTPPPMYINLSPPQILSTTKRTNIATILLETRLETQLETPLRGHTTENIVRAVRTVRAVRGDNTHLLVDTALEAVLESRHTNPGHTHVVGHLCARAPTAAAHAAARRLGRLEGLVGVAEEVARVVGVVRVEGHAAVQSSQASTRVASVDVV